MRPLHEEQAGSSRPLVSGCTSSVLQLWHYQPELHLWPATPGQQEERETAVAQYMQEAMQQLHSVAGVNNTEVGLVLLGAMPRPEAAGSAEEQGAALLGLAELSRYMQQLADAVKVAERAFPQVSSPAGMLLPALPRLHLVPLRPCSGADRRLHGCCRLC